MLIFLRSLLFNLVFYITGASWSFFGAPLLLLPRAVMHAYIRFGAWLVLQEIKYIAGITYICHGAENMPQSACLMASNHQSMWETVMLPYILPGMNFVSKKELFWIPFFGWNLWKAGDIFIDRRSGPSALRHLLRAARRNARWGRKIWIFPTGTRAAPAERLEYKPGIAALYKGLNLPCVPVALNSGLFWPRRSFLRHRGCVQVHFLPVIPPGLDRKTFMKNLETAIEDKALELASEIRR